MQRSRRSATGDAAELPASKVGPTTLTRQGCCEGSSAHQRSHEYLRNPVDGTLPTFGLEPVKVNGGGSSSRASEYMS